MKILVCFYIDSKNVDVGVDVDVEVTLNCFYSMFLLKQRIVHRFFSEIISTAIIPDAIHFHS